MKNKILAGIPISKIHDWERYYFFIRNDAVAVDNYQARIFSQWKATPGRLGIQILGSGSGRVLLGSSLTGIEILYL